MSELPFFPEREAYINVFLRPAGECRLAEGRGMTKPAKRIPRWLTIDLMILVVGALITVASALWLGTNIQLMVVPPS